MQSYHTSALIISVRIIGPYSVPRLINKPNRCHYITLIVHYSHKLWKSLHLYIYISVLTCRKTIINASTSVPPNASKIAVKKDSDVTVSVSMFELEI